MNTPPRPFKRGEFLLHGVLGLVIYVRKVKRNADEVIVKSTAHDNAEFQVNKSHLSRDAKRPRLGKDKNRQLLIECLDCDYRLRGSYKCISRGIPDCPLCKNPMKYPEEQNAPGYNYLEDADEQDARHRDYIERQKERGIEQGIINQKENGK